jgi:hypothetical protein
MAGMCWHVGFLRSAWATLEVVFHYLRRQINRKISLPYLTLPYLPTAKPQKTLHCLTDVTVLISSSVQGQLISTSCRVTLRLPCSLLCLTIVQILF